MHQLDDAHMTGDEVLPMFLAAGVTTIRDAGDTVVPQRLIARYAEADSESCPRVFLCSPLIFRNMILLNDLASVNQHPDNAHAPARLPQHWEN